MICGTHVTCSVCICVCTGTFESFPTPTFVVLTEAQEIFNLPVYRRATKHCDGLYYKISNVIFYQNPLTEHPANAYRQYKITRLFASLLRCATTDHKQRLTL
jgi:hypothetical protein